MDNPADRLYISLQLALGGDGREKAFTRIWRVYGKRIHYYISKNLPGDPGLHDDCFQEVMMKIFAGLRGYRPDRPLKPWLYRVVRNGCLDFMKKRCDNPAEDIQAAPDVREGDPGEHVIRSELFSAIGESVDALAPEDAQLAFLRFFEKMKFGEIARMMEMNENTVKTKITAIRRKLRDDLREWL